MKLIALVRFALFCIVCLTAVGFFYWGFGVFMIWLCRSNGFGLWLIFSFLGSGAIVLFVCGILGLLLRLIMLISPNIFSFVFALICIVGWGGYYTYMTWMSDPSFFPHHYQFFLYVIANILLTFSLYLGASNTITNES